MVAQKKRRKRDVEKNYPVKQFVKNRRRLADCIEQGQRFQIQVAGERISIPSTAIINIEHERGASSEEVEFQLKWLLEKAARRTREKTSKFYKKTGEHTTRELVFAYSRPALAGQHEGLRGGKYTAPFAVSARLSADSQEN